MLIQEFLNLCPEIEERAKRFLSNPTFIKKELEKAQKETAYFLYGIGGKVIPRGVLNPNPFIEMNVTNVTRGKLVCKEPKRDTYYTYAFDQDDRLLYVRNKCDIPSVEVIVRDGTYIWGLEISESELDCPKDSFVRVHGAIVKDEHVVAVFYTHKYFLKPGFETGHHIEADLIHYENRIPVQNVRWLKIRINREENGKIENIVPIRGEVWHLIPNDKGDIVKFFVENIIDPVSMSKYGFHLWIKELEPVSTSKYGVLIIPSKYGVLSLEKPVPRSKWEALPRGLV